MASYYEALPIFRAAMDCAVRVDAAVQRFPKGHKYTLGSQMRAACAEILLLVARGNRRAERARWLPVLCDRVEELKLLCQLGKEVKAFDSFNRYGAVVEQVVALARQAEAWRRSQGSIAARPEPAPPARGGRP